MQAEDDIAKQLAELYYIDGSGNITPHPKPAKRLHYKRPIQAQLRAQRRQQKREWIEEIEREVSLTNKNESWHKQQLSWIKEELKNIPLVKEIA
jgi:hypothetical protein